MNLTSDEARRRVFESIERLGLVRCVPEAPQLGVLVASVSMAPPAFLELVAALENQADHVEPFVLKSFRELSEEIRETESSGRRRCERVFFATPMWVLMRVLGVVLRCDSLSAELCRAVGETLGLSAESLTNPAPFTAERLAAVGASLVEWADAMEAAARADAPN